MGAFKVMQVSDEDCMLRYAHGDLEAFQELYERHRGGLYRFFLRQSPRDVTEELFQDVWTQVIQGRRRYRSNATFRTWLYTLACDCLIDWWRREGRESQVLPADTVGRDTAAGPGPRHLVGLQACKDRLQWLAEALPTPQREAFLLRHEGDMTLTEIAAALDIAVETARSRLREAVQRLCAELPGGCLDSAPLGHERNEYLADLYRRSSLEQPPARLDRAIMAEARQSLQNHTLSPIGNHRIAAAALAGIGVLSLLLVLLLPEQAGTPGPPQSTPDADATGPVKPGRSTAAPAVDTMDAIRESAGTGAGAPVSARQRFDFYSVLPETEPQMSPADRDRQSAPVLRQAGQAASYYLQIGGYRNRSEAGELVDKLEFMRLNVHMQQITTAGGQFFYRLSVGPYSDMDELERVRTLLQRRGIDSTRERAR